MATLTLQNVARTGVDPAAGEVAAASGGDEFTNDGGTMLRVNNGGGGAVAVTITAQTTEVKPNDQLGKLTVGNVVVSVGAGLVREIGPFPPGIFNDANGRVQVTYDQDVSVTVAARRLPVGD